MGVPADTAQDVVAAPPVSTPAVVEAPGVENCSTLLTAPTASDPAAAPPAVTLPCLTQSSEVSLPELARRPTVVNLWATWCGPCREEMPLLQRAAEDMTGEVQFVGVDTRDSPVGAAGYLEELGISYPQLVDVEGALLARLRMAGLPVTLVIDADGRLVAQHLGPMTRQRLDEMLVDAG